MFVRLILLLFTLLIGCTPNSAVKSVSREPGKGITYSGGDGGSFQEAVTITGALNQGDGVAAEYHFISEKYGQRGTGWLLVGQTVIREKNKIVDVIEIQLGETADRRIFYFDVSDFSWKGR